MIYKSYEIEKQIEHLSSNLVLFYGENLGLKDDFKKKIKNLHLKAEFNNLSQEEIIKNQNEFFQKFLNISLFKQQKIYFIDQVNDKFLDLIKELEKKIDNQNIYLFADILDKKSKIRNHFEKSKNLATVACYNDNEISLKRILLERLKGFTGLSQENINLIIKNSNLNRSKMNNELNKIENYFENKKLSNKDLYQLLNIEENDNFNTLKDAAINGDSKQTNYLLSNTLIENEKIIFYLSLFNQRFDKLKEIISMSEGSLEKNINSVKPPIFWKDKPNILNQAKKWDEKKITTILQDTFDLELKLKSNADLNKNILVKKLVVDVCNIANS